MDFRIRPVELRTFTTISSGSDIDCIKARPSYSAAHGGTATLVGTGDTNDQRRILPTRLRLQTNGNVTIRQKVGVGTTDGGTVLYHDCTITGFAGEWIDLGEIHVIVAASTTADIQLGWPV